MNLLSTLHTDVGIRKKVNQDSLLLEYSYTDYGQVLLAVVCDGMGGLAKGEVASANLVKAFQTWFSKKLPSLLYGPDGSHKELDLLTLSQSWKKVIEDSDRKIANYGAEMYAQCGTTIAGILIAQGKYFIVNVGDSRVYQITENTMSRLTTDHTFIEQEMQAGRLTYEQAIVHPQRNALLQCVGVGMEIIPEFEEGTVEPNTAFMLCSDGFRHVIKEEEFMKLFSVSKLKDEKTMNDALVYFTELNKQRKERDNISSILIKVE